MDYVVATIHSWNITNFEQIKYRGKDSWHLITEKEGLTFEVLEKIKPRFIFIPHWSWIIPEKIWSNFECVVFHMTDLPYGRGGTPLQNLILNGHTETNISALRVDAGVDTGDIYIKEPMSLDGSAQEIYERLSDIIFSKMIPDIIKGEPAPKKQSGEVVEFKRRTKEDLEMPENLPLKKQYDFIRMLDAKGYPHAYVKRGVYRYELTNAKIVKNECLKANVKIYEDK